MRIFLSAACLAAVLASPAIASADAPDPPQGGPSSRDQDVEVEVRTADPAKRVQLQRVELGDVVASPAAAPPPPIFAFGAPVVVHTIAGYEPVCEAPCTARVAPGTYRLAGYGVMPSSPFTVRGESPLRLKVDAGTRTARTWGYGLAVFGGVSLGVGITSLFLGRRPDRSSPDYAPGALGSSPRSYEHDVSKAGTFRTAGWILVGNAAAAIVASCVVLFTSLTSVEFEQGGHARATWSSTKPSGGTIRTTPSGFVF